MGDKIKRTSDNRRIDERFVKVPVVKDAPADSSLPVRLNAADLSRLDDWISRQRDNPSRSEAVRRLIHQALEAWDLANRRKR